MVRPKHARRAAEGFTLIEMLIVVAIIAVTAALAAPAMHSAAWERKNNQAALDLVRVGRRARSSAIAYGRAHVVRFDDASGNARFRVFRGISSACNSAVNDWNGTIVPAGECGASASFCVDWLDLGDSAWVSGSSAIVASRDDGGGTFLDICYEPRGKVLYRQSTGDRFTSTNTVNGGFVFRFDREEDGTVTGVSRRVVLPLGGDARLLQ